METTRAITNFLGEDLTMGVAVYYFTSSRITSKIYVGSYFIGTINELEASRLVIRDYLIDFPSSLTIEGAYLIFEDYVHTGNYIR